MKKLISFILILLPFYKTQAQLSNYDFSYSTGAFTEYLNGDTVVATATGFSGDAALELVNYVSNHIPFNFNFNGTSYNNIVINANGFITFGPNAPSITEAFPVSSSGNYSGAISALGNKLIGTYVFAANSVAGSPVLSGIDNYHALIVGRRITGNGLPSPQITTIIATNPDEGTITLSNNSSITANGNTFTTASGSIVRVTTGSVTGLVHIIQWNNFRIENLNTFSRRCTFQIRLYENINKIELAYGEFVEGAGPNEFSQVGIRGASNMDFQNRTGFNWVSTVSGITNTESMPIPPVPVEGTKYSFTPRPGDVGVTTNLVPAGNLATCYPTLAPKVIVRNFGSIATISIPITYKITGPVNYTATKNIILADLDSANAELDSSFVPNTAGTYNVTAYSTYPGDDYLYNDTVKSSFTLTPASSGGGAGSNCNYYFSNSTTCANGSPIQPAFSWQDTTGSTSLIVNGVNKASGIFSGDLNDGYFRVGNVLTGGKKFRVCGTDYDSFFISTNGMIGLSLAGGNDPRLKDFFPSAIPSTSNARPCIFAFWRDLNYTDSDVPINRLSYKLKSSEDKLIITYDRVPVLGAVATDYVSFQVILGLTPAGGPNDGSIIIQFNESKTGAVFLSRYYSNALNAHTVGFQNSTGTQGIQYRFRNSSGVIVTPGPLFNSSLAIAFGPPLAAPVLISPANNATNQSITPHLTWTNVPGASGYYLQISRDLAFGNILFKDSTLTSANFNMPPGVLENNNIYYWRVYSRTASGNAALSDRFSFTTSAAPGAALDFDGVNDYVSVPDLPGINNFSSTLKFSIQFWCKVHSDNGNFTFVNKGGGGGLEQYSIDIFGSNLRYYVRSGGGVFTTIAVPRITVAERWVNIAATFDYSAGIMKLYKNGIEIGSESPPSSLNSNSNPFVLGAQAITIGQPLYGEMDELRIWNFALNQTQVNDGINCEVSSSPGLLANFHFNQGTAADLNTSQTFLTDASGNVHDGTLNNFALNFQTSNWVAPGGVVSTGSSCGPGSALDFDGVNDNITVPNLPGINNFSSSLKFSIEFWCKVNSNTGDFTFINKGGGGGLEQYSIDIFGPDLRYYVRSAAGTFTYITIPRIITSQQWVHFAATFDYSAGIMKLYKNAIEVGSATPPSSLNSNTNPLSMGTQANSINQPLNGRLDEVRIWNRALTPLEVNNIFLCEIPTSASGLVSNYHFNQGTAAVTNTGINFLTDASGYGNNGTLNNFSLTGVTSNWIAPGGTPNGLYCYEFLSILNIKIIPQGFYNSNDKLNMRDTLRAYLHSNVSPYNVLDSSTSVVDSVTFTGSFGFTTASGTYYIVMKHRNSIETWSKSGGENFVQGSTMNYDFTNDITKAFGSNEIQVNSSPLRFGVYSGDVIHDDIIDVADIVTIYNDVNLVISGYVVTDVTGDDFVDVSDLIVAYNNVTNVISVIRP